MLLSNFEGIKRIFYDINTFKIWQCEFKSAKKIWSFQIQSFNILYCTVCILQCCTTRWMFRWPSLKMWSWELILYWNSLLSRFFAKISTLELIFPLLLLVQKFGSSKFYIGELFISVQYARYLPFQAQKNKSDPIFAKILPRNNHFS